MIPQGKYFQVISIYNDSRRLMQDFYPKLLKKLKIRIMKKILTTFILMSCFQCVIWAQQEPHYTHFMQNKLAFNPAYAGSHEVASISALYRRQWVGLNDAPHTQTIYTHMPLFENRVGFGLGLIHDTNGPIQDWNATMSYAYRIEAGKGKLAMGLQGSVKAQRINFSSLTANDLVDNALVNENASKILPGFGAGLYYYSDKFYAGASIPNLIRNSLSYTENGAEEANQEIRHFYMMTGAVFGKKVKFKPSVLFKYAHNTPFDADLNLSVLFADRLWVGATYRIEDALAGLIGVQIGQQFRLGASYDYTLTPLKEVSSGSIEVFAEYLFRYKNDFLMNPRFFF